MKSLSLHKLMMLFVLIFSGVIILAAAFYISSTINNFNSEKIQIENNASRVVNELQKNVLVTNHVAEYISESTDRINNIEEYLKDNPEEYANYILKRKTYFNWPNTSKDFFIKNVNLAQIQVRMIDNKNIFIADRYHTTGKIVKNAKLSAKNMIYESIVSPSLQIPVGMVALKFNEDSLIKNLRQVSSGFPMQILVTTNEDRPIFIYNDKMVTTKQIQALNYAIMQRKINKIPNSSIKLISAVDDQYKIAIIFNNSQMGKILFRRIIVIVEIAILVLFALYLSFFAIFSRYRLQLKNIISTTEKVSVNVNDPNIRINTHNSRFEDLTVLATSINNMLDEINHNINIIYKLRIAQQDAHMKALQSQISPHFMANTLEYIRMSALDSGNRNLAKVVYNFAALLRSNVGTEMQTTLKKEAKIVGNYIYLYQVRFPDKLAYQIVIPDELKEIKLPKFSLQPLVENYFVHGVDFAQSNNAIEIKAFLKNNRVIIKVEDNGKKLSESDLAKLNQKLKEPIVSDKSIGLQNVYARMSNYTQNFAMKIINNQYGGLTVILSFDFKPRED